MGVRGGGKLVLLEGGRLGGHAIHRWNRLVLYIMGKIVNKSVQQHRGHGRSFSISTNQKPVFDQYFGYGMTANLQPSYLCQFNSDFDTVKSKVGLLRLRLAFICPPPSQCSSPPLSVCSPFYNLWCLKSDLDAVKSNFGLLNE